MNESERKIVNVQIGDIFSFVTYIEGRPIQLTGSVEVLMPSSKARKLGLTRSKRRRLGMLLRVDGYEKLFFKDKGQVKLVSRAKKEGKVAVFEKEDVYGYQEALEEIILKGKE